MVLGKVAVLGPKGTFSEAAADDYYQGNCRKLFFNTLSEVFDVVEEGKADEAVVPVENVLGGTVMETLMRLNSSDLLVKAEVLLEVHYVLASMTKDAFGSRVFGHPQAIEQCREFLKKRYPETTFVSSTSNAQALQDLVDSNDGNAVALGPKAKAEFLGLEILFEKVEGKKHNLTRFFVVGKEETSSTGKDRTTVVFDPLADRPGLLYDLLGVFASRKVNLSKIESAPSKKQLGTYVFFLDFEGHREDELVVQLLEEASKLGKVKILGSYPMVY
ncbi:MAG: prephenate dehydratase [Candidatus Micrarchaeia archaeon]